MLDDRGTIDQIITRRQALASIEAAEAFDLLTYVDRARVAGETISEAQGRRRVDAAVHELLLEMKLPVPTVERQVSRARRLRSRLPSVWQAWHDGRLSTAGVEAVDRAARRLTRPANQRHAKAFGDRSVNLRPAGDGMTRLSALLSATDATAIMQSLTGAAHQRPASDSRTIDQTRADLLADTLLGRQTGGLGYRAVIGIPPSTSCREVPPPSRCRR